MSDKDIGKIDNSPKQVDNSHLLEGTFKPETGKANTDQAQQIGKVGEGSANKSADNSEKSQLSANDLKVASPDAEVCSHRSNLGDSAKAIGECMERLGRGTAAPEGKQLFKDMMAQMKEHYDGKNLQTGEPRGSGQLLQKLVQAGEK